MDLGERIAAWLRWFNITPSEIAVDIDVTAAAVYQWIGTGKHQTSPSQENLQKLVSALGITMERFYGRVPGIAV